MAVLPQNILQQVQTYQRSSLGLLLNLCCMVSTANTKFKDFDNIQANLGSTVTFDLPPYAIDAAGLVWATQPAVQRVLNLTADQSGNASFTVTSQQRIFNLEKGEEDYMRVFGRSFITALANRIEGNLALNTVSGVVNSLTGTTNTFSGPVRFYGDATTPLNSYQQLAQSMMLFKDPGMVNGNFKYYLPNTIIPSIVGNGLNQFVPRRNDEIANSWEIGDFGSPAVMYYQSNLLPVHISGNTGVNGQTLTVVSVNDSTGQNVTQITCSGATNNDANAVLAGDLFQFKDGVTGFTNMRFVTTYGKFVSSSPVQMRATANAAANGSGNVVLTIVGPDGQNGLNSAGGITQNINQSIQPGMQILTFPSHKAGMITGGDAFYIAMPQLPEQDPFPTANEYDADTGVSLRLTYGSLIGQNQTRMGYDAVWGSTVVPEYSMRVLVPLSQA